MAYQSTLDDPVRDTNAFYRRTLHVLSDAHVPFLVGGSHAYLQYTGIVFSSIWGVLVFADKFDWHSWLGIGIILASGSAAAFYNTKNTERGKAVASTDPIASEV